MPPPQNCIRSSRLAKCVLLCKTCSFCPILMKNKGRNTTFSSFLLKYRGQNTTFSPFLLNIGVETIQIFQRPEKGGSKWRSIYSNLHRVSNVSIWNVNCARAAALIFDTRTGALVKVSKFWDRKCLDLRGTRTPNLRIHAQCSNLLSYIHTHMPMKVWIIT